MKFTRNREENKALHDELLEMKKTIHLEAKDTMALIIAALTTLLPMLLIILAIFLGITWLIWT